VSVGVRGFKAVVNRTWVTPAEDVLIEPAGVAELSEAG
jgi:hypothetical protein